MTTRKRLRRGALLKVSRRWRRSGVQRLLYYAIEQTQRQGHRRVDGVGALAGAALASESGRLPHLLGSRDDRHHDADDAVAAAAGV